MLDNTHRITNETSVTLNVLPQSTKVLRKDFWGLFKLYNETLEYELATDVEYLGESNGVELEIVLPDSRIVNKEILYVNVRTLWLK